MICVIPFCHKDARLALRNLEWAYKLDGKLEFDAILSYDEKVDPVAVMRMEEAACSIFRSVSTNRYDSPHEESWPLAANHAWQRAAWCINDKHRGQSWFWWEADATPLRSGWLTALSEAHRQGNRPFAGHIVMGPGKLGHMNGVGIYPWNVVQLAPHAMITRHAPFDAVLKDDAIGQTHPLNHLICHFPRANGICVSVSNPNVISELLERGYVLFHGCTDGTLIDLLEFREPKPVVNGCVRYFEKSDIGAPLDEAETKWQHEHVRLKKLGWDIISFKECQRDVPPISEQVDWPNGFFNLPLSRHLCHFNCSLTRDGAGQLWLFVRQWQRRGPKDWHSVILACKVDAAKQIVETQQLRISDDPFTQYEDPRVVWMDGKFYVSLCVWSQVNAYAAKQVFCEFNEKLEMTAHWMPTYGYNDPDAIPPETGGSEKNWVWFNHEGNWHFVYSFSPHVVARSVLETFSTTQPSLTWKYGEIRGGTPPVRTGEEYVTFFHSSLPWKKTQKRYYMGAYAFEAKPPFRVTRVTTKPLLSGSEHESRIVGGPLTIFPCGNVFENGVHMVSFGVNDESCAWVKIPQDELWLNT